jgi:hypothetical protein
MRLAVIGSRNLQDFALVVQVLDRYRAQHRELSFVSGGAVGADTLAAKYAVEHNIPIKVFLPEWDKYGKRAGFIRNTIIWNHADAGVAFWDGVSRGTEHSFHIAAAQNKPLEIVRFIPTHMRYTT